MERGFESLPQRQKNRGNIMRKNKSRVKEGKEKKERKSENLLEIVRLMATDLNGKIKIRDSLRKIKGINFATTKLICQKAGINPDKITGKITDEEKKKIEEFIKNPEKFGIPDYMFNLRNNPDTGKSEHLTGADLQIKLRNTINQKKKLGSYVGLRHREGLPVRGQRTKSSFRKSKSVGVSRQRLKQK